MWPSKCSVSWRRSSNAANTSTPCQGICFKLKIKPGLPATNPGQGEIVSTTPVLEKHVVITGGGSGIGAAIAERLHGLGANLTLMGRDLERLEKMRERLSRTAAVAVDIADPAAVKMAFQEARDISGRVAVLINNAGSVESARVADTSIEAWNRALAVNLSGVFHCTREILKDLLEADYGRIINVASTAGLKGYAYVGAYCAAKHGVIGLTRSLALELARTQVTVNAVCPGYTDTAIVNGAIEKIVAATGRSAQQAEHELLKVNPQGRLIDPQEVAATVAWLCGHDARSINGQAIAIAGGEV